MLSKNLILKVIQGDVEVLCRLLETEIEYNLVLTDNERSDKPSAREILSKAGAHEDDQFRKSLLHVAVATRNIEFVKLLLEAGCDINSYNRRGESVLYFAIIHEYGWDAVKSAQFKGVLNPADRIRHQSLTIFLLDLGADVNSENGGLIDSPLFLSTKFNNVTITRMLLEKGAYVNKRNILGWTPLHIAIMKENILLIELLLDNGADVSSESPMHGTPITMATSGKIDNSYDIIKILLERGANCNEALFDGQTVLGEALFNCDCRTVKLLLDYGADIKVGKPGISTALHFAATNPCADVIEYILDYGFDVNTRDAYNRTALHIAISKGHSDVSELLLSRGANLNCIDGGGNTPLYLAVLYGKYFHIKNLLEYGAEVCSKHPSQNAILNLANASEYTIVRTFLIEHVAKLVSLNTWVSEIELEAIKKDFKMESYYKKCIKELEKMKIRKIYENVCLFDILMERGMASGYARNEDLIEALQSSENKLRYEFPIYYSLLNEHFLKEIKKQRLIKGAAINLNNIFNFHDPFHFVNLKILSYLHKEDIIKINETE